MRSILFFLITAIFALTCQTAQARFVLVFDDPSTQGIDKQIEDNGSFDLNEVEGVIEYVVEDGPLLASVIATSKPWEGTAELPAMVLRIRALRYTAGSLNIMASETDFSAGASTADVTVEGTIEGGDSVTYNFYGDTDNQLFEPGFNITTFGPYSSPNLVIAGDRQAPADPLGSLTVSISLVGDGASGNEINGAFTGVIEMVPSQDNVEVPDVVGMTQSGAESAIESAGLTVGTVSTESSTSIPAGNVISQDPVAGWTVVPNSKVNIVVSTGAAPSAIPNPDALSGNWYDPATDGEGWIVINSVSGLYLYYFGHDAAGDRLWLLSSLAAGPFVYGQSIEMVLYSLTGTFANPSPEVTEWGDIIIIFDSCTEGRAQMIGRDGEKRVDIVKLAGIGELVCDG